jgi:hypothetical protein
MGMIRKIGTFKSENLKRKKHLRVLSMDERVILKSILKNRDAIVWTRFIWLKIGHSGRFLWTQ